MLLLWPHNPPQTWPQRVGMALAHCCSSKDHPCTNASQQTDCTTEQSHFILNEMPLGCASKLPGQLCIMCGASNWLEMQVLAQSLTI